MIHSVRFTAVLDTNVIYPVAVRDLLLWFAHYDLYTPKWSAHIFEGWKRVMIRKGVAEEEAIKRVEAPNRAFPDAFVQHYQGIISSLTLPDPDDCHVLAAAIKSNANVIVSNNIKDFPEEYLRSFGIRVQSADDFLTDIIDLNHELSIKAFREMVMYKKNPEMDIYQVLEQFRNIGLKDTADYLHSIL